MSTALDWLRERSDEQLLALLRARPDLIVPAPSDLAVLARRLDNPTSVHRVLEGLPAPAIAVLQAAALAAGQDGSARPAELTGLLGPDLPASVVRDTLAELEQLGVLRTAAAGGLLVPGGVASAIGEFPAGLGAPGVLTIEQAAREIADCDERAARVLRTLDSTGPRGTTVPGSALAPVVSDLVKRRLLIRVDAGTVELPREVGLALRGERPLGHIPQRPELPQDDDEAAADRVDRTAAGQALATVDQLSRLIADLGEQPPAVLRSGGLGIRELRRLAKSLGVEEHRAAMLIEIASAAGLISTHEPRSGSATPTWQPTVLADELLTGTEATIWARLATGWIDLRRDPSRAGSHDAAGKLVNALAPELSWVRGPADRRFILRTLAELPAGRGLSGPQLTEYLAWRAPLRSPARRDALAAATLTEATWLGVVAFDTITSAGRALLAGDDAAVAAALTSSLPEPVDTVVVQADLTVVAPGRLTPELAALLQRVAEVESSGSATVYRVTPDSVRGALDSGLSAADLHQLFAAHSATSVPQVLSYLIDDVARKHGQLRLGSAATYLRSDDAALIDAAVGAAQSSGFVVRRLAPTVAISTADPDDLREALQAKGIDLALEDPSGALLQVRRPSRRIRASAVRPTRWREGSIPSVPALTALVERLRGADDEARPADGTQTASQAVEVLRQVQRAGGAAWIEYVDSGGQASRRLVDPVVISGGTMVAFDRLLNSMKSFALHRISSAAERPDGD